MPIQVQVTQVGLEASIQSAAQSAGRNLKIDLGTSAKSISSLSQPLGRITGQADQFTKSMEAANARVLAFGASVGVLGAITQGFKEIISTTVKVEKSMADINSVLGANSTQLNKFKNDIFAVAKETGSSFDTVSNAALELSRQGLKSDEVLRRLKDSMILARLSGLDATSSVEGLTAAVNSFSKSGVTTSEVLNKISKTAAAYSVSERDLIEGFKRSASVAQQAGVSLDELGGIITAVQQKTARGGAVIGNAFKTIFTRIQRPDSLQALQDVGAAVTDMQGGILPATKLIENLAQKMNGLNDIQKANITEKIGGGFQIGPLLAALDDLTNKTSSYRGATEAMATAGNEAYTRNTALNQTLAAAINTSTVNLQQLANTLGEIGVTDSLKNLLGYFNSFASSIEGVLNGEGIGSNLAKGLVKGIGNILSGPGLAIFGAIIAKLTISFIQFSGNALKTFFGIGNAAKEINTVTSALTGILTNNKALQERILSLDGDRVAQARLLNDAIRKNISDTQKLASIANNSAPTVLATIKGARRGAAGYMPAVAQESSDIQRGVGGAKSSDRPVVIPNFNFGGGKTGAMVAHTGEHIVPNFAGSGGSAIFNREMIGRMGLPSGAQKIGAAGGFVPNFVDYSTYQTSRLNQIVSTKKFQDRVSSGSLDIEDQNIYNEYNKRKEKTSKAFDGDKAKVTMLVPQQGATGPINHTFKEPYKGFNGFIGTVHGISKDLKNDSEFGKIMNIDQILEDSLVGAANTAFSLVKPLSMRNEPRIDGKKLKELLSAEGAQGAFGSMKGAFFEAILDEVAGGRSNEKGNTLDVALNKRNRIALEPIFGLKKGKYDYADYKNSIGQKDKFVRQAIDNLGSDKFVANKASGYIPNFADPLKEAISREVGAGVNPSQVYVDQHSSLKNSGNPMGLMVANRRDEPLGGLQGINRARKEGSNPQMYGAASGFVPNFAGPMGGADTNMLSKLLAFQIGISMMTGFLDQAGESGKKVSDALNKVMTTLLIFGTIIYSGPIKALREFSDRLNKSPKITNQPSTLNEPQINTRRAGFTKGFGLGVNKRSAGLENIYAPDENGGFKLQRSPMASMMSGKALSAARVGSGLGSVAGSVGAGIGAVAAPALMAVGAFKAVNDAMGAFAIPSKNAAKALGEMSIVASEAASSLSALETSAAATSASTSKGPNSLLGMIKNTFGSGIAGGLTGVTQEISGYRGTKGRSELQLSGISSDDFYKMQEDFTKTYLAANKEGSLKSREYNAKAEFEKTLGIDTTNSGTQGVGELEVGMLQDKLKILAKEAAQKKGILSIDEVSRAVLQMTLKDSQRAVDFATQRAVQILKTKGALDGSLSVMDKEVLSAQILNNLTEKQNDALNARVALRDREVSFGETQLNNLNQQVQSAEGVTANLDALTKYYEMSAGFSQDGVTTQEELNSLAEQALLIQNNYSSDGVKLNEAGLKQLEIQEKRIKNDFIAKDLADKQAAAKEKETAKLKEELNTRENILSIAQRTAQAESFKSNFSAQQGINSNNLAIAKLGLQQPTSQAGTRALNLQKANLEAANVPLEADKTRTDVVRQFRDELIELAKKTKDTGERFASLSGSTQKYSDVSGTLLRLENIKSQYLAENNGKEDERTRAVDTSIQKFKELTTTTDEEIKNKGLLSQVTVEQAKQAPVIQDLTGKLSDFAESLKSAIVELQFKKLSETSGTGMLDLTAEQRLNTNLQSAGTDKSLISDAYSQAAIAKDQQRLSLATSGKDRAAITYDMQINQQILDIKKEAVDQDQLSEEQLQRIIELEKKRINKNPMQKFKEAFSETDVDRSNRMTDTLISGAEKFRDTMIDGMVNAIEKGGSLGDILQSAALDFAREMTRTSMKNLFSSVTSSIPGFASGGKISGGSGNKDDVPAMLMGGEFVINKKAVSKYGSGFMDQLNKGTLSHFASGGSVGDDPKNNYAIFSGGQGSDLQSTYSSKASNILNNGPTQTGMGGFQMPGYGGQGKIVGKNDLLDYATQSYTSGYTDQITNKKGFSSINLEAESLNLTQYGRTNGPMAEAIAASKGQAFDLRSQQIQAEIQKAKEEKAAKKALRNQIIGMVATAAVSAIGGAAISGGKAGWTQASAIKGATDTDKLKGFFGGMFQGGNIDGTQVGGLKNLFTGNYALSQIGSSKGLSQYNTQKFLATPEGQKAFSSALKSGGSSIDYGQAVKNGPYDNYKTITGMGAISTGGGSSKMEQYQTNLLNKRYGGEMSDKLPYGFATGGKVPMSSGIDTVPAMLSGGEFVMNAAATQKIGPSNLAAMNSGVDTSSKDSKELNDRLIAKLDELIVASKENGKGVTVNVSSDGKKEETTGQAASAQDQNLNRKIKAAVIQIISEEKRIGGSLRRN